VAPARGTHQAYVIARLPVATERHDDGRWPSAPACAVNGNSAEENVMEYTGPLPRRLVGSVNGVIAGLRSAPLVGPMVSRHLTVVTYTGRRSGRTFSTPVAFRQAGDTVTISVDFPRRKKWWRNFTGEGGPLSMELDGTERAGHAVAAENGSGKVIITVRLSN
jgi:hypothetical protein